MNSANARSTNSDSRPLILSKNALGEPCHPPIPHSIQISSAANTCAFGLAYTEESATGMAAGPLACVLHDHLHIEKDTLLIEQGRFMEPASPSLITVELAIKNGEIQNLMAGGHGKVS